MTRKSKPATPTKPDKSMTLKVVAAPDQSNDQCLAEMAAAGIAGNAFSVVTFGKGTFGELSLTDCMDALKGTIKAVRGGDLSSAETMLASQAAALNAIFGEMARRASLNMGEHLSATETYMRLALKAQGQCRAKLETLAAIKNPPVVFARQANINNGGQQQVNNGVPENRAGAGSGSAQAHAEKPKTDQTELLGVSDGEWLDTGTAGKAGRDDPHLAPVGAIDRAANGRRQGPGCAQR